MNGNVTHDPDMAPVPSLISANLLFLLGMILVLTAGVYLQQVHFGCGLLATELLLGAMALIWTRLNRLPWRPTLRLYPAKMRSLALAFALGVGLWLLDTWLGAVTSFVLGYDLPVPAGMYPQSLPAALLLLVAMAVGAPLGEELFFRGYMQRAYVRMRPLLAITSVALLFSLFHMSLVGLPPRVPVALALGYVAWRSGSLWSGVVLHAANNAAAVFFLALIGLRPELLEPFTGGALAVGGPLAAVMGLVLVVVAGALFHRGSNGPLPLPAPPEKPRRRALAFLPLLLALLLYGGVAALEFVSGNFPELLAAEPLSLEPVPWSEEVAWEYRLQHPGEETVGNASCEVAPGAGTATLNCLMHHEPFEVRQGTTFWAGGDLTRRFIAAYDATHSSLLAVDDVREFGDLGYRVSAEAEGETLLLQVEGQNVGESWERIPTTALIDELWPWQLSNLPFAAGAVYEATLVYPQRYDPALERSVLTVTDSAVVVGGVEPLSVPAGDFFAWRVSVGDETAWYDAEPPHMLLQYDSGPVIWQLEQASD